MAVKPREKPKGMINTVQQGGAKKIVTVAPLFLTGIIILNPVAVVQTVSLIFNFGWMNAIALVVTILGGMIIEAIMIHIHDSQRWDKIIGFYFCDFNDCLFEPIKIEELEQGRKRLRDVLHSPPEWEKFPFLSQFLMPSVRAFYVHSCNDPESIPLAAPSTYPMAGGTTYVFLHEKPKEMDFMARFVLLHEIGHAAVTNKIIDVQGWFAVVYFSLLFVFVAFHQEAGIPALIVAFALAAMWAHYMRQQDNKGDRLELVADAFALVNLAGRPDFRTGIAGVARSSRRSERYRAWLLVRRAQILSRSGRRLSLGGGQDLNWFEQLLPVPLWLCLLMLAGMVWLGVTLSISNLKELLALSLVWVVVPALGHSYYMFLRKELPYTARGRRKALDFLQAHVPEYDLRFMSVAATEDLLDVGRNLIIVALVGPDLHIRIFDSSENKVIDKSEKNLIIDKTLMDLKKRLTSFQDEFSLSKEDKQKIIRTAIFNLLWE